MNLSSLHVNFVVRQSTRSSSGLCRLPQAATSASPESSSAGKKNSPIFPTVDDYSKYQRGSERLLPHQISHPVKHSKEGGVELESMSVNFDEKVGTKPLYFPIFQHIPSKRGLENRVWSIFNPCIQNTFQNILY